jgi:hypothetical protein
VVSVFRGEMVLGRWASVTVTGSAPVESPGLDVTSPLSGCGPFLPAAADALDASGGLARSRPSHLLTVPGAC